MHFPYFMRRVNRVITNPLLGGIARLIAPLALVHHVGRKSGRSYRTPVVAFRSAAGFVIPMTYGRDVDWARNIVAARGCEIERLGQRFVLANPRVVGFKAARQHLPVFARLALQTAGFPGYVLLDLARGRDARGSTGAAPRKR